MSEAIITPQRVERSPYNQLKVSNEIQRETPLINVPILDEERRIKPIRSKINDEMKYHAPGDQKMKNVEDDINKKTKKNGIHQFWQRLQKRVFRKQSDEEKLIIDQHIKLFAQNPEDKEARSLVEADMDNMSMFQLITIVLISLSHKIKSMFSFSKPASLIKSNNNKFI